MRSGVTAVIPVHFTRLNTGLMSSALESVYRQTHAVDAIAIAIDSEHNGAAVTRNRGLDMVRTKYTAFLDSDDQWRPDHVERLLEHAEETGADLVYPWFTIIPAGQDPWPDREGQPFSADELKLRNYIPVTVLAKTRMIKSVGGFRPKGPPENPCDDWGCWDAMLEAGAKFSHLNRRTWYWRWHVGNTSGRGDLW
jgi:glycosyltransferase involved in cell wall biosynthesis